MSVKSYYKQRESSGQNEVQIAAEKVINRKCWLLLKSLQDTKLKNAQRWGSPQETIVFNHEGFTVTVELSSSLVGNPDTADVSIIQWGLRETATVYSEMNSMELNLMRSRVFNTVTNDINIMSLYLILKAYHGTN
ncbi:hypothetical protein POP12_105 [Pectobacterium phage POP12]|nr:hypothetical protein POP12_105 [Pectobacterium phage POP12]